MLLYTISGGGGPPAVGGSFFTHNAADRVGFEHRPSESTTLAQATSYTDPPKLKMWKGLPTMNGSHKVRSIWHRGTICG